MSSKIAFISQAFTLLGKGPIHSLEVTPQAQTAAVLYDRIYPTLLTRTYWHFARKIGEELNLIDDVTGVDEWQYAYQLPVNILQLYRLRPNVNYVIAEDKIYTNYKNLTNGFRIDYTYQIKENKLPVYFQTALVYTIAAEIAMPITQQTSLAKLWTQKARAALSYAMWNDASNSPSELIQSNPLWRAHFV